MQCHCQRSVEPAAELTVDEVRRYSRHLIIPDVGMTGQKRLKNARVLVIGRAGLGSPALLYLAAAGVGTLGIAEFDEVDESNLQRQIIHGQSDIGKPKAISAQESIAEANPLVKVIVHNERLDNDNVARDLQGLRPHRRRHRQLRHPLHGQRRGVLLEDPLRVGLDLPLRRPGERLLADADQGRRLQRRGSVLPLPLPRAAAARDGPQLRRGRRPGRAVREHRLDPGQRGHQAARRHRRRRGGQAGHLRRPRARSGARSRCARTPTAHCAARTRP